MKQVGIAITVAVLAMVGFISFSALISKGARDRELDEQAAKRVMLEKATRDAEAKEALLHSVALLCPELESYIADTNSGVRKVGQARYKVETVIQSGSTMLNDEIASDLNDAKDSLEEAEHLLRKTAPDYVNGDTREKVDALYAAADNLKYSIASFLNFSNLSDGTILAQRLATKLSAMKDEERKFDLFGRDELEMLEPEVIERARSGIAKQQ